jgi:hypothetical protein
LARTARSYITVYRKIPFAYLKDVLERLPSHPVDRLGELLPDAWIAKNPKARREIAS